MSGASLKLDDKKNTGRGQYLSRDLKFDFMVERVPGEPDACTPDSKKPTFHVSIIDRDGEPIPEGGAAWRYVHAQTGQPRLRITFSDRSFKRFLNGKSDFTLTLWGQKEGAAWGGTYKGRDEEESADRERAA